MNPAGWGAVVLAAIAVALAMPKSSRGLLLSRLRPAPVPSDVRPTGDSAVRDGLYRTHHDGVLPVLHFLRLLRVLARLRRTVRGRAAEAAARAEALESGEVLAAELRAGRPPLLALEAAFEVRLSAAAPFANAPSTGAAMPAERVLTNDRVEPGSDPLRPIAVAWQVAEHTGAGLAGVVDRVVSLMRDEESVRQEVAAQLAGPRATAKLLAALPALGLAVGSSFGTGPILFLLTTPLGLVCLAVGGLLAGVGVRWVERLARRAETFE